MTLSDREKYFLGDSKTIMLTHTWGTGCNLQCSFCLNSGEFNLFDKSTEQVNYEVSDVISNLVNTVDRPFLFIEHGGELLYCKYLHELFEYKIRSTKNYRAIFFTNGTSFKRYKELIDKFSDYLEPFLTFHPMFMSDRLGKDFIKCLEYNIEKFGYCNISFVYYDGLVYEDFKRKFDEYLLKYKDSIKIKVFFDKDMLDLKRPLPAVMKSYKFMSYLDEHYHYKRLLNDDYHANFKAKTTFYINKEQRKGIISKFMSAIEIVDDKIMYFDLLKRPHTFPTTKELSDFLIHESQTIKHSDIDTNSLEVINGLIEIL